jgi:hypothetical protein
MYITSIPHPPFFSLDFYLIEAERLIMLVKTTNSLDANKPSWKKHGTKLDGCSRTITAWKRKTKNNKNELREMKETKQNEITFGI